MKTTLGALKRTIFEELSDDRKKDQRHNFIRAFSTNRNMGSGIDPDYGFDDEPELSPNHSYSSVGLSDVYDDVPQEPNEDGNETGVATLQQIAQELGMGISGAKMALDKAVDKFKFLTKLALEDPKQDTYGNGNLSDYEIMVLLIVRDYINYLKSSGELDEDDVQFLFDHPDHTLELDGFRSFMHPYIKYAMQNSVDELIEKIGEDDWKPVGGNAGYELP